MKIPFFNKPPAIEKPPQKSMSELQEDALAQFMIEHGVSEAEENIIKSEVDSTSDLIHETPNLNSDRLKQLEAHNAKAKKMLVYSAKIITAFEKYFESERTNFNKTSAEQIVQKIKEKIGKAEKELNTQLEYPTLIAKEKKNVDELEKYQNELIKLLQKNSAVYRFYE